MNKEWLLQLICLAYAPFRGKANRCDLPPRHTLVWQMAKLGDMVCTTPMFHALKQAYPQAHITVVGSAINKQILEGNTDVDEYLVFTGFLPMLRTIRRGKYDAAFITSPSTIAIAILFLGGVRSINAPRIAGGFSPYETAVYRKLLPLVREHPHHMRQYAPRQYLRLLEGVDIVSDDTTKHLIYSEAAEERVKEFFHEHDLVEKRFVALSPSAGNKIKRWPGDRFARVAEYLAQKGYPVVVIGGSRDREEVMEMMQAVQKNEDIINAVEKFSIDELKAFIAHAALFVSVDTGPIYIAEAFGVPTVDIVGPVDENEQPPIGPMHSIVVPPQPRTPQLFVMNARGYDSAEAQRQNDSITVAMVTDACDSLIAALQP